MSMEESDPYNHSVFGYRNKFARTVWWFCYIVFFRYSPKPMFGWRRFILRIFGAKLSHGVNIYPNVILWAPWNLECGPLATVANGAEIYNPEMVRLGSHAIISQDAYLCGATHDHNDPRFTFVAKPIVIGAYAWVCARAVVMPGITIHDGAILGLGSVATRNLEPWSIYAGLPARFIKKRIKGTDA